MATASCSVADLRLDRWLEAWCWAGPIALWCSGAKLDLLSVGNQMFAVLLLQFDESTMRIKDRKLLICLFWCPTHWTGRIGQFCNWRCTVGRRWLLQTSNDSRFRIFATMMVGWSLRTDSHPQFRLAKEEQGRSLNHCMSWGSLVTETEATLSWWECPWRVKKAWWCDLFWFRAIPCTVPVNHRHTTDHDQVTFIFSGVSWLWMAVRMASNKVN